MSETQKKVTINPPPEEEEEEEEDEVAVERLESWYILTTVHGKTFPVTCGDGSQRIKWLAHVSIGKFLFFLLTLVTEGNH